jgi:hypothetical protein
MNVNEQDIDGKTQLAHAVIDRNEKRVVLLLEQRANPDICDHLGCTPVHHAITGQQTDRSRAILRTLVLADASIDHENALSKNPWEEADLEAQRCIALALHKRECDWENSSASSPRQRLLSFDEQDDFVFLAKLPIASPKEAPINSIKKKAQSEAIRRIIRNAEDIEIEAEVKEALKQFTYASLENGWEDEED